VLGVLVLAGLAVFAVLLGFHLADDDDDDTTAAPGIGAVAGGPAAQIEASGRWLSVDQTSGQPEAAAAVAATTSTSPLAGSPAPGSRPRRAPGADVVSRELVAGAGLSASRVPAGHARARRLVSFFIALAPPVTPADQSARRVATGYRRQPAWSAARVLVRPG